MKIKIKKKEKCKDRVLSLLIFRGQEHSKETKNKKIAKTRELVCSGRWERKGFKKKAMITFVKCCWDLEYDADENWPLDLAPWVLPWLKQMSLSGQGSGGEGSTVISSKEPEDRKWSFSTMALLIFWTWWFSFVVRGCPVYYRKKNSTSGLHPLGALCIPSPSCDNPNISRHYQIWRVKSLLGKNHRYTPNPSKNFAREKEDNGTM